jgi:hypothetical protein
MIAFPQRLPNVVWRNQRLVPLYEGWIRESIVEAAARAGFQQWDLAPEISQAITRYLEDEAPTVTVAQLTEIVRRSLKGIGFDAVARESNIVAPRVSIYLPELARSARYEMMFFPLLGHRIGEALEYNVRGVQLEGLRDCVKIIDHAMKWRQTCAHLSDQIVEFTKAHLERAAAARVELVVC